MNTLEFPPLLVELMNSGRWKQPSDETIKQVVPFMQEPVDFLLDSEKIQRESSHLLSLVDVPKISAVFHEYKGSEAPSRDLPWLDVEKTLLIAINRISGDDIAIALDFRTDLDDPRVVASDWWSGDSTHYWREVESRFSDFVKNLGI